MVITVGNDPLLGANYFYRALNGFVGFYLFQEFFKTKEDFRSLLLAFMVAGLVPLGMSAYQNILGGLIRSEATIGNLVRNIGFYHDAYTLRIYCFQTLAAVLLYWCYFLSGRRIISRGILLVISALALLGIIKLYSKAGYMVIAEWLVVWYVGRRKFLQLGVLALMVLVLSVTMERQVQILDTVYSKEVGAMYGKEKSDRLFQGRVGDWKTALREFEQNSIALQLIGDGSPHTGAHNDFLRALFGTGILGLLIYCVLLVSIGIKTVYNCLRQQTPLNIMAVMLIGMWSIDAIGLVPGAYPGYQIFVWGFIGLALRGVAGLDKDTAIPTVATV
jgi:O-antigen ligase